MAGQPRAWFPQVSAEGRGWSGANSKQGKLREWALGSFLFQNAQAVKLKLVSLMPNCLWQPLIWCRQGMGGEVITLLGSKRRFLRNSHFLNGHKGYLEICSGSLAGATEYFLQFCTCAFNAHCTLQEFMKAIHLQNLGKNENKFRIAKMKTSGVEKLNPHYPTLPPQNTPYSPTDKN